MRRNAHPPVILLRNQRYRTIRHRPNFVGLYWRDITSPSGFKNYLQRRDWLLVLSSRRIPYAITRSYGREHVYVPPLAEKLALAELSDFAKEGRVSAASMSIVAPLHYDSLYVAVFLLPLIVWHAMRCAWIPAPDFLPPPSTWFGVGALDTVMVHVYGQWWRTITSLTLHADFLHLLGNTVFGALFLPFLARLVGVGRAVWLAILGGVLGNVLTVMLRNKAVVSLGFSTALFAAIGAMAGVMACRQTERRKGFLQMAAAAGMLAMLGMETEGGRTDYAAHGAGLLCGLILGVFEGLRVKRQKKAQRQFFILSLALLLPLLAWWQVFIMQP